MIDRICFTKDELERMLQGETITTLKTEGGVLAFSLFPDEVEK